MQLINRFKNLLALETKAAPPVSSLSAPEDWLADIFAGRPVASGIIVTPRTAMTCAPVRCAVQAIAESVGQLPVHVYRRDGEGKERATDHPAYALLRDESNGWTSATQFRQEITRDALLYPGGGFAFINRDHDGTPLELIRLDPETAPVTIEYQSGEPIYSIQEDGTRREIDRHNILHIPSPSLNGAGIVHEGREAIGLALVMGQYAARLWIGRSPVWRN